jgi:hypothetical protein
VYFNYVVSLLALTGLGVEDEGLGVFEFPKPNLDSILFPYELGEILLVGSEGGGDDAPSRVRFERNFY